MKAYVLIPLTGIGYLIYSLFFAASATVAITSATEAYVATTATSAVIVLSSEELAATADQASKDLWAAMPPADGAALWAKFCDPTGL